MLRRHGTRCEETLLHYHGHAVLRYHGHRQRSIPIMYYLQGNVRRPRELFHQR